MAKYQISVQDIFFEVARVLKGLYPNSRVHQERIADLKTPAFSIELVQYSTPIFSQAIINKRVDLDIIYYSKNDTIAEALEVQDLLTSAFSMGLMVYERDRSGEIVRNGDEIAYKRFIHCLRPPEHTLVDQDLHFMVTFEFADNFAPVYLTLDEIYKDGQQIEKEALLTAYNTGHQTLENKELEFKTDEEAKAYIDAEYELMQELKTQLSSIQATIEIKGG